ncbi:hypothetical protein ACFX2I_013418 [Malus domestica]
MRSITTVVALKRVVGCHAAGSKPSSKWYGAHMVLTVVPRVVGGVSIHEGFLLQFSRQRLHLYSTETPPLVNEQQL